MFTKFLIFVVGVNLISNSAGYSVEAQTSASEPVWNKDVIDLFSHIPIQEGGRIKPISTYAGFMLLRLNGKRECRTHEGRKLTPTEWLMDCLFRPELAQTYPCFLVDDSAVLDTIGVSHDTHKRRDRYSYVELLPGREKLMSLAQQASSTDRSNRSYLETKALHLAQNMVEFEYLIHHFDFARHTFELLQNSPLRQLLGEATFSTIVKNANILSVMIALLHQERVSSDEEAQIKKQLPEFLQNIDDTTRLQLLEQLERLFHEMDTLAARSDSLAVFPPEDNTVNEWLTPGEVVKQAFFSNKRPDDLVKMLELYENLARSATTPTFRDALSSFLNEVRTRAEMRGEYKKIPLEVMFYRLHLFYWSLIFYLLCFVVSAVSWLVPKNRPITYTVMSLPIFPTMLLLAGITMRCIIRGRPPVTTLYETILFATAVAAIVSLVVEWFDGKKIAISVGSFLGALGLFIAFKYEAREGVDTMPSLVAVLDTNFWLATHVTTITIGYGAGLLAGAFAHIYILVRLMMAKHRKLHELREGLTRMVYGTLCFSIVFSVVGTVLGGIWAAESWGRFWGWDPKENGALLIILWQLMILHARKSALIRELGLHVTSVFQNVVIAFSWWGINQLGVGLHSYGHTSGIQQALYLFYLIECFVILLGIVVWIRDKYSPPFNPAKVT